MYLEVYIFNAPSVKEEQVWDKDTLPDFPASYNLRKKIEDQVPNIQWVEPDTGNIDTSHFLGQIIFGMDRKLVYFRIAGGNDPIKLVLDLCLINGWSSYTPENELFLDSNLNTLKYWQEYNTYKGIIDNVFYKHHQDSVE